jgi:predicted transcriptional regulator
MTTVRRRGADEEDVPSARELARQAHQIVAANHRDAIFELLLQYPEGLTDFEIEEKSGIYLSSVNGARNKLLNEGLVIETQIRRPSGRGGIATVWRLSRAARCRQ